jgi:hypothetical protein
MSVHIWRDPGVGAKLEALRGLGESYSDVIVRLAKGEDATPAKRSPSALTNDCEPLRAQTASRGISRKPGVK